MKFIVDYPYGYFNTITTSHKELLKKHFRNLTYLADKLASAFKETARSYYVFSVESTKSCITIPKEIISNILDDFSNGFVYYQIMTFDRRQYREIGCPQLSSLENLYKVAVDFVLADQRGYEDDSILDS